ncbi:MAG: hypothetical protein ACK4F4_07400 [Hylemonella sp.]|uniref:hypothetical protein n=1 Tax=Hylemonella sp. TaxID=2066020 RepID=UPI00391BBA7B
MKPFRQLAVDAGNRLVQMWTQRFPGAAQTGQERGSRTPSDVAMERYYRQMWIDTERRAVVQLIRKMDHQDGRVKEIHSKTAGDIIRGGLVLQCKSPALRKAWEQFQGRLQLNNAEKLKSDARGLIMEGNLMLQLVPNQNRQIVSGVRMPSDTMVPMADMNGRFKNPALAWEQRDVMTGTVLASFAAWQMAVGRLDPDNWDDVGCMGRPLLDACAKTWRKLTMTEEDLVIRRRTRAPLRLSHILEGADDTTLQAYRKEVENEKGEITTDFYANRKGGVTAVQGDANMDQIADVVHLLDTFFAGAPGPKALFGYTGDLNRDILEDLKRSYYDKVDGLQDAGAGTYAYAFRIDQLLQGVDPDPDDFYLRYAERRTETANQVADLGLKWQALGLPEDFIHAEMGLDPVRIRTMKIEQAKRNDPYPNPLKIGDGDGSGEPAPAARVKVTPGNAPKGESATAVNQPGSNGGRGR